MQTSETEERFSVCLIIIIIRSITHEVGPKKKKKNSTKKARRRGLNKEQTNYCFSSAAGT